MGVLSFHLFEDTCACLARVVCCTSLQVMREWSRLSVLLQSCCLVSVFGWGTALLISRPLFNPPSVDLTKTGDMWRFRSRNRHISPVFVRSTEGGLNKGREINNAVPQPNTETDSRTEAKQTSETTRASPAARYSTRREQGKHTCPRKDGRREPGTRGMVCQTVDGTAEIRCGDERNSCSNTRVNGIPERWGDAMSHWCGGGRACGGTSHKEPLKETQKGWRNPAPPGGKRQPCCAVVPC